MIRTTDKLRDVNSKSLFKTGEKTTYTEYFNDNTERTTIFRSKSEARFVEFFLSEFNIEWQYEPQSFYLKKIGKGYIPDFYLPKQKIWVEYKGFLMEEDLAKVKAFAEQYKKEILLVYDGSDIKGIQNRGVMFYDWSYGYDQDNRDSPATGSMDNGAYMGECSNCKQFFICGQLGSFHCRNCGAHEGDHDILNEVKHYLLSGGTWR